MFHELADSLLKTGMWLYDAFDLIVACLDMTGGGGSIYAYFYVLKSAKIQAGFCRDLFLSSFLNFSTPLLIFFIVIAILLW